MVAVASSDLANAPATVDHQASPELAGAAAFAPQRSGELHRRGRCRRLKLSSSWSCSGGASAADTAVLEEGGAP